MSLRELDLFGVIGLLGVVSVLRAFVSRHPRLPRERRKKRERKKKERERTRDIALHILYISSYPYYEYFPHFFWRLPSREHTLNKEGGDHRHACLDELLRCGAVQRALGEVSASVDDDASSRGGLIIESIEAAMSR